MRHIARGILVVVALFVLAVGGTLVVRSRAVRVEPIEPSPTTADLRIKEVDIEEDARGVRWRLTAEQAEVYESEGRTTLRRLAVDVFERDRSWTIVGDEGDLFQKEKHVEIRRNVVVSSSDGVRLETSVLRWDGAGRRLWTDAPVTLSRERSVIRGSGLEVRLGDERTTVTGPVHARFEKPAR
jgi:LPS export ABC transporter protein LptC